MGKKDVKLLIILAMIIAVFFYIRSYMHSFTADSVRISENGEIIGTYPLSEDKTVTLKHNKIKIINGEVFMEEADCPDKSCIKQGAVSHTGDTIACLPNRVVIEITGIRTYHPSDPVTYSGIHFDTLINVTIYDGQNKDTISDLIRSECDRYELICSRTDENSELYRLNNRSLSSDRTIIHNGNRLKAYRISKELYEMIDKGKAAYKSSGGRFNIAIAPLSMLWNFKSGENFIPEDKDIADAMTSLSPDDIILCDNGYVAFADDKTMIDLGGLAKGYIADSLKTSLLSYGVKSAVISLGGNVNLIGDKSGKPFKVGVRKPFNDNGDTALTVEAEDVSVVTSGTYERYFIKDGILYHHILDPLTGYPYDTDISSATVICGSSTDGDILSTTLLAMNYENAEKYAEELRSKGIYVILLDKNGDILYNSYSG